MVKNYLLYFLASIIVLANLPLTKLGVAHAADENLILNPSVETINPSDLTLPDHWNKGYLWGDLDANYSYQTTGQDGSRSLKIDITRYNSGDAKWYFDPATVQANTTYLFSDYYKATIGTTLIAQLEDTSGNLTYKELANLSAQSNWTKTSLTFTTPANIKDVTIFHSISAIGSLETDNFSLTVATAPKVTITAPQAGTTLSNTVQLKADASDQLGVKNVQFKVDGVNVGNALTVAPYQTDWDTSTTSNGAHTITAVATNANNLSSTSDPVSVTVTNAPSSNLVPNPSVETVDPNNTQAPANWQSSAWGNNTAVFSYLSIGHTGTHSVKAQLTQYTDGDAKWYFTPQTVSANQLYTFTDYYKANIASEVDVAFDMSDGSTLYQIIGLPEASTNWAKFTTTFSVPLGAQTATVFHLIHNKGNITIDDVSVTPYSPVGFNRALISLTFDDGYDNEYINGLPLLQKYGLSSTQYIISGLINQPGYMTSAQIKAFAKAGHEIGSHTVTHRNLLTLTSSEVTQELANSQRQLQNLLRVKPTTLAFPNGLYNASIITKTKQYYSASRGVEDGLNSKDNFNAYDIKVENIYNDTTANEVANWVQQALTTKTWLVLVYHSIRESSGSDDIYNATPAQLDAQLSAIKNSGITTLPLNTAFAEVKAQIH